MSDFRKTWMAGTRKPSGGKGLKELRTGNDKPAADAGTVVKSGDPEFEAMKAKWLADQAARAKGSSGPAGME